MQRKTLVIFWLLLCSLGLGAQNTVGVLSRVDSLVQPGVNLFYPHNQSSVFLLDNCGRIVHEWSDSAHYRPGNTAYLQENGDLFKTKRRAAIANDPIWGGGGGHYIEKRDWDNNLLWSFGRNDALERLHHDFTVLPNGNVMMIVWEYKDSLECIAMGRNPNLLNEGKLWPDYLLELQPVGSDSFNIAWEWHIWDHLIQNYDSTKPNYGDPAQNPGKIDLNFVGESFGDADWQHSNALDYNPDLDQVMLCIPTFSEIWIIDHSTTIQEAAGSSGGNSGKGGDLLWRWGNPAAYSSGDSLDQQLFYQHDAHWIEAPVGHPDHNKVIVFNNNAGPDFSSVDIITPDWDPNTQSYQLSGNTFAPASPEWRYMAPTPQDMFSSRLSSAQRLPNGNTLIVVGRNGYTLEVTPSGDIAWEYENPFVFGNLATQGDSVSEGSNIVFRMRRIPADFPAFANRVLTAGDYLEIDPDSSGCSLPVVSREVPAPGENLILYPQPAQNRFLLSLPGSSSYTIEMLDLEGRTIQKWSGWGADVECAISTPAGLYLLKINHGGTLRTQKLWVID